MGFSLITVTCEGLDPKLHHRHFVLLCSLCTFSLTDVSGKGVGLREELGPPLSPSKELFYPTTQLSVEYVLSTLHRLTYKTTNAYDRKVGR